MALTASLKVMKEVAFKGNVILYSNRYHFDGGAPGGSGPWTTLSDSVVTNEKAIMPSDVRILETFGYAPGSDVPVFQKSYTTAGTFSPGACTRCPAEVAILVRYATTQRTSKNHPIYLFQYFHNAFNQAANQEKVCAAQLTAVGVYAGSWVTGFSDGSVTHHRAGPNGAVAQGSLVEEYVTHRDFPYRSSV